MGFRTSKVVSGHCSKGHTVRVSIITNIAVENSEYICSIRYRPQNQIGT